jgi:hypothetical protein
METAYLLEKVAGVSQLRQRLRGLNPKVCQELLDLREMALRYEPPVLPEAEAASPEVATGLGSGRLNAMQAADLIGISDRAVRLACTEGRLDADLVGGRWRVTRDEAKRFRDERCA